jgi:hypothetical protein
VLEHAAAHFGQAPSGSWSEKSTGSAFSPRRPALAEIELGLLVVVELDDRR